jgi:hypothetical protein
MQLTDPVPHKCKGPPQGLCTTEVRAWVDDEQTEGFGEKGEEDSGSERGSYAWEGLRLLFTLWERPGYGYPRVFCARSALIGRLNGVSARLARDEYGYVEEEVMRWR